MSNQWKEGLKGGNKTLVTKCLPSKGHCVADAADQATYRKGEGWGAASWQSRQTIDYEAATFQVVRTEENGRLAATNEPLLVHLTGINHTKNSP